MSTDNSMFSLEGKTAFVTGGTAGIGLAVAKRFSAAGAKVAICSRRDGTLEAEALGGFFIEADVADEVQVANAFRAAERKLGKLDIVVNNAGMDSSGPMLEETNAEEFQRVIDVNVKSVFNGMRYGIRHMNDDGSIINTGSAAGTIGLPGYSTYGATKAAVESLTRNVALELTPRGIRVNCVCPGTVFTEMIPPDHPEVEITKIFAPMGRIAEASELVGIFHFLAADESSYVTGQAIHVDGGITAGIGLPVLEKILD